MESILKKRRVVVLMSTYNGEKYLREQIDSILTQKGIDVQLIVRDDGSKDGTVSILKEYQQKGALWYYTGENLGPKYSFLHLLREAPPCDFYAFSDQDDVWLSEKLYHGIGLLQDDDDSPALYFSQTQQTDETLHAIPYPLIHPRLTFGESLIYAYASGCTMIFNDKLRSITLSYHPSFLDMHDRWLINLTTAFNGHLVFDKNPYILYRQHAHNVIGLHDNKWKEWKLRLHRIFQREQIRSKTAQELLTGYQNQLPQEHQEMLTLFTNAKNNYKLRIKLLFDSRFRCGNPKTWFLFKLAVIANSY
ncbi:MAG: glycosyltransferase family 2 protein [Prevotella sp.]|nr:glycosyltransferase family 2 protein [Prevotella sp.]